MRNQIRPAVLEQVDKLVDAYTVNILAGQPPFIAIANAMTTVDAPAFADDAEVAQVDAYLAPKLKAIAQAFSSGNLVQV